jgi:hypothetical protein
VLALSAYRRSNATLVTDETMTACLSGAALQPEAKAPASGGDQLAIRGIRMPFSPEGASSRITVTTAGASTR